jgi:hypothetical protein
MEKQVKHKWSKYFKHEDTYWKKCVHCGLFAIPLMSTMHYSKTGKIGETTTKRPNCNKNLVDAEANY